MTTTPKTLTFPDRHPGSTNDCVVRAICIATGKPYQEVYQALCEVNDRDASKPNRRGWWPYEYQPAMDKMGIRYERHKCRRVYGREPTVRRFTELNGDHWKHPVLIRKRGHLFVVSRGKCNDTTGGRAKIIDFWVLPDYPTVDLTGTDATTATYKGRAVKRQKVTDEQIEMWCFDDLIRWGKRTRLEVSDYWEDRKHIVIVTHAWRRFQGGGLAAGFNRFKRIYQEVAAQF